jgi:hypothetical protein
MSTVINFNYNGTVIQRRSDGFVNLTQMCQANGKRLDNWLRLKSTQSYLTTLAHSLTSEVVDAGEGGSHTGTWGHPSVAINLARWLSDEFAVWCDAHIFNLMETGSTSLDINPVEEMKLRIELARLEAQKEIAITKAKETDLSLTQLRYTITQTCPEHVQQKVLGYQVVEKVEYRDRILLGDDVIRDGSTINKTQLCQRYGYITRNGKPDYAKLKHQLAQLKLPEYVWKNVPCVSDNKELDVDYLSELDALMLEANQRQLFIGE